ncbi:MAG: ABC transporter permease [Gemmataceae bacterium]|nr:ABC transporter permease [Gemmataceae bacterium]
MKKALAIGALLIVISAAASLKSPDFLTAANIQNNVNWSSLWGILAIGSAFVIIAGGIDLSIGSVVCLSGCLLSLLLHGWHIRIGWLGLDTELKFGVPAALTFVLVVAALLGLGHGLLITKLRLQPFVVTLCGLLLYRGFSRWITDEQTQGFGDDDVAALIERFHDWTVGTIPLIEDFELRIPFVQRLFTVRTPFVQEFHLPIPFLIVVALGLVAGGFLHWTIYGRYLLALGRNEQAARYSGIATDRMVIVAYVLCSLIAGFGGVLLALEINSVQPSSFGAGWELTAIAAAVLGGCSLRGGEGSILGVIIGAALIRVILNATFLLGVPDTLADATTGLVILLGVIADELFHRLAARRRLRSA